MLSAHPYRVDQSRVVHETIEGETILIDLESGTYFSLRGTGPEIWALLVQGHSEAAIAAELARRYPEQAEDARASCVMLIAQLRDEGLVQEADAEAKPASIPIVDGAGDRFAAPMLERYTDMQYFLMLDPIHQVHEDGWPRIPEASAGTAEDA